MMTDVLKMDYLNSLPQPFTATFLGGDVWPVYDIEVGTALLRIDVCGKLQVMDFGCVTLLVDADGGKHDPETLYSDYAE